MNDRGLGVTDLEGWSDDVVDESSGRAARVALTTEPVTRLDFLA
jgi:hypothetical protein